MNQTESSEPTEKGCAESRERIWRENEERNPRVLEEANERPYAGLTQFLPIHRLEERGLRNLPLGSDQEQMVVVWATADGDPERMVYGPSAAFWRALKNNGKTVVEWAMIAATVMVTFRIASFISTYVDVNVDVIRFLVLVPVTVVTIFIRHRIAPVRMVLDTDTYNEIDDQIRRPVRRILVALTRAAARGGPVRRAVPQQALLRARRRNGEEL